MIETDTRLRTARGIAKTETAAATIVFETLQERGHPTAPPPIVSDGWGGNREAMVEVYGQVPEYQGRGGGHRPANNPCLAGNTCRLSSNGMRTATSSAPTYASFMVTPTKCSRYLGAVHRMSSVPSSPCDTSMAAWCASR